MDVFLLFSGKPLDVNRDGSKLLKEYHFQNMDSINYSQKMHGGGSVLEPLEGHVSLTKDPCCITYDDNPRECRAKLACGHSIGSVIVFQTLISCICHFWHDDQSINQAIVLLTCRKQQAATSRITEGRNS